MAEPVDTGQVRAQIRKHGDTPILTVIELCDALDAARARRDHLSRCFDRAVGELHLARAERKEAEAAIERALEWCNRFADSGGQGGPCPPPLHELLAALGGGQGAEP